MADEYAPARFDEEEAKPRRWDWIKFYLKKRKKRVAAFLAWAVAVVVILWLLFRPPEPQFAWITGPVFNMPPENDLIAAYGENTGIENIYIARWGKYGPAYNPREDLAKQRGAALATISGSGQRVRIPANRKFDIVVAVRVRTPIITYVARENMCVRLITDNAFAVSPGVSNDKKEYVFEQSGYGTMEGYMRVNVVWDNDGNGYELAPDSNLRIVWLGLYTWKMLGV